MPTSFLVGRGRAVVSLVQRAAMRDGRVCDLTSPNHHLLALFEKCTRTFGELWPDGS
jgi:hypothetical protein